MRDEIFKFVDTMARLRSACADVATRADEWRARHAQRLHTSGLAFAALVFGGGLVWSLSAAHVSISDVSILPCLLLIGIFQPLGLTSNVIDYRIMARMAGAHIGWQSALSTVIYARAANFLPVPGGMITRVAALRLHKVSARNAAALTVLLTALWAATAFGYAGLWLLPVHAGISMTFVGIGAAAAGFSLMGFARLKTTPSLVTGAVLLRVAALMIESFTLMLSLHAVGQQAGFSQASIFVVSTVAGVAVSIVPAGLGIREGVVALLAPLVGIAPAAGFLAAMVARITEMTVLLITLGLYYRTVRRTAA